VVATLRDVRIYQADTGKLTDIYQVVADEEISAFSLSIGRRFLVGTDKGHIKLFSKAGELMNSFQGHSNEVFSVQADTFNKVLISTSWDSDIGMWRERMKGEVEESLEETLPRLKENKEPYMQIR
jgi:ligand-binding sensor domain-containing protein